jgi:predicted nucleic acid-binding protein
MSSGFLLDSSVLIDVFTRDAVWFDWSSAAIARAWRTSAVFINPIIFAEVSASFADLDDCEQHLPPTLLRRAPLPYPAGFLAAKAFVAYRRRGGLKTSPLPDFYIGAHAVVQNLTLVTRDAARFRTYFPTLRVVAPQ